MPATVLVSELDIAARLASMRLNRQLLIEVIRACVSEYGNCTDNDPPSARGYEPWRWGTRELRERLLPGDEGWLKDDTANLSSIRNDDLKLKIIMLNSDDVTGNPQHAIGPRNRLKKGILHERAIGGLTGWLPNLPLPYKIISHDVWYFCLHINGDKVLAELSKPAAIEGGYIRAWHERIIILGSGDWETLDLNTISNDSEPDIEINVRRK